MNDDFIMEMRRATLAAQQAMQRMVADINEALGPARHTGTVKWFDRKKGHGFIVADNPAITDGRDIFVHYSAIEGEGYRVLYEGSRVSFTLHDFGKGPQARSVRELR